LSKILEKDEQQYQTESEADYHADLKKNTDSISVSENDDDSDVTDWVNYTVMMLLAIT